MLSIPLFYPQQIDLLDAVMRWNKQLFKTECLTKILPCLSNDTVKSYTEAFNTTQNRPVVDIKITSSKHDHTYYLELNNFQFIYYIDTPEPEVLQFDTRRDCAYSHINTTIGAIVFEIHPHVKSVPNSPTKFLTALEQVIKNVINYDEHNYLFKGVSNINLCDGGTIGQNEHGECCCVSVKDVAGCSWRTCSYVSFDADKIYQMDNDYKPMPTTAYKPLVSILSEAQHKDCQIKTM